MHIVINKSKHKNSKKIYNSVLLRQSYRENGKVKKRTIANLSACSPQEIAAMKLALKHKDNLAVLGSLDSTLAIEQGLSVGAVWSVYQVAKQLGIVQALGNKTEGKLALWQIITRVIEQGSRLSSVRSAQNNALTDILNIEDGFNENDLYSNLDWLSEHQESIEKKLYSVRKKESNNSEIFLYDVTSSYLEGDKNYFGAYGYNRDKKKGKKQIVIGLLCDADGTPLSVEVFPGNKNDTRTFASQVKKVSDRFGGKHVTFVGDRGMIKIPQINELPEDFHYITAITNEQVRNLVAKNIIQLEFFDEDLFEMEISGTRYILRLNPDRKSEIRENREAKYKAVAELLSKKNSYLKEHKRAKVSVAKRIVREKIEKLKLNKWLRVESNDRELVLIRDEEALNKLSVLDGCYVLKTDLPMEVATKETIHARYKDLSKVEFAFRTSKLDFLEVRPIYVRKELRTRGHVFVVMLSYMIVKRLREAWKGMELTIEEGLRHLSNIITVKIKVTKTSSFMAVTKPDKLSKELLDAIDVIIPNVIPHKKIKVVTKTKLRKNRK